MNFRTFAPYYVTIVTLFLLYQYFRSSSIESQVVSCLETCFSVSNSNDNFDACTKSCLIDNTEKLIQNQQEKSQTQQAQPPRPILIKHQPSVSIFSSSGFLILVGCIFYYIYSVARKVDKIAEKQAENQKSNLRAINNLQNSVSQLSAQIAQLSPNSTISQRRNQRSIPNY